MAPKKQWRPVKDYDLSTLDGLLAFRRLIAIDAQFSDNEWRNQTIWEYINHLEKIVAATYREGILRTKEGLPFWRTSVSRNELPFGPY